MVIDTEAMAVEKTLDTIEWCKESWEEAPLSVEARGVLRRCSERQCDPSLDKIRLQHLIDNSNQFPIPFPVHTVRLESLKSNIPAETLERNARSTYPLIHERVLVLMANFLLYKRKYGSIIEKEAIRRHERARS
ncbi:hypothetical protein evm_012469 [Chilo suppressalis]|nr:hypothetical protein evm_012469 [Chilo suppressalis]